MVFLGTATYASPVDEAFSLFSVNPAYRHRFEKAEIIDKVLEMNLWYEDASVTRSGQPTDNLFCRISHMLIYGRHKERSKSKTPALQTAFDQLSDITGAKLNFFTVFYTNKPLPPEWAPKPGIVSSTSNQQGKLRVVWAREEKVIPYLSYTVSRGEWKTLANLVKTHEPLNFEDYRDKLCPSVLKLAPNLKANFKAIESYIKSTKAGVSE